MSGQLIRDTCRQCQSRHLLAAWDGAGMLPGLRRCPSLSKTVGRHATGPAHLHAMTVQLPPQLAEFDPGDMAHGL
jgi:hypothetical protein